MRWWPPVTSAFMLEARLAALASGDSGFHLHHTWVDRDRIAASVQLAVIASEDQKFPFHHGFDLDSIHDAMREQEEGGRARLSNRLWSGASPAVCGLPAGPGIRSTPATPWRRRFAST